MGLFKYWNGSEWVEIPAVGPAGADGAPGAPGADGEGVVAGGNTGQVLTKASNADYDTAWGNSSVELSDENALPLAAAADSGSAPSASREDHVHGWTGIVVNDTNAVLTVAHGATASTARPSTPGVVLWVGSVTPTNALARDIVFTEV